MPCHRYSYYKAGRLAKAQQYWDRAVSLVQYDKSFPEDAKAVSTGTS